MDAVAPVVDLRPPGAPRPPDVVAEAVARLWCGEDVGQLTVREAAARTLVDEGARVLRVEEVAPHDPDVVDEPGCPLVRPSDDVVLPWVSGREDDGRPVWVPYSLAVVRYLDGRPGHPLVHTPHLAGLGSASTADQARDRALADLVAHDALHRWWTAPALSETLATPGRVLAAWADSPLRLALRRLPAPSGRLVALALVDDPERDVVVPAVAARHRDEAEDVWLARAAAQAVWRWGSAVDLLDPRGALHSAAPGLLPHRADRAYLSSDPRAGIDPLAQLQLGLDPRAVRRLRALTAPAPAPAPAPASGVPQSADPATSSPRRAVTVGLTAPSTPVPGHHVVRVLAPSLRLSPVPAFAGARPVVHTF